MAHWKLVDAGSSNTRMVLALLPALAGLLFYFTSTTMFSPAFAAVCSVIVTFAAAWVLARRGSSGALVRELREHMGIVLEHAPLIVWSLDEKGNYTFCRGQALKEINLEPTLVIGKNYFDLHGAFPNLTYYAGRALEGSAFCAEMEVETRWFSTTYLPLQREGKNSGFIAVSVDITKRIEAERELARSKEMFQTLANNISQLAFMGDPKGRIFWLNDQWSHFTGLPTSALSVATLADTIHPDFRARVHARFQAAVAAGEDWEDIYPLKSSDGKYSWFLGRAQPIRDRRGRVLRYFGTLTDITQQREAEHAAKDSETRFRQIAESMPQLVWTADPCGNLNYCNKRWTEYTGTEGPSTPGFNWCATVHEDDIAESLRVWREARDRGVIMEREHRMRRADGQYRWQLARAAPIRDEEGKVVQWFGTITDVHDLRTTKEDLEAALRARDEFLSIASHELKTPLTSLKLKAQTLRRAMDRGGPAALVPEKVQSLLDQTDKQVGRLGRLIEDMLDISRIRTGKLTMQEESADLGEIAAEAVERIRGEYDAAGVTLELNPAKDPLPVYGDKMRIDQVITNLLSNALRYGRHRPVRVHMEKVDGVAVVKVEDEGIGVAPEAQQKIFNRFERAVSANEISGLGLGLYISQQIVAAHGGEIRLHSEVGKGSCFEVRFPLQASLVLPFRRAG